VVPARLALNLTDSIARLRYRNGRERGELVKPGELVSVTLTLYPTSNLFMPATGSGWTCRARTTRDST
jgi:predicted acyl esterase